MQDNKVKTVRYDLRAIRSDGVTIERFSLMYGEMQKSMIIFEQEGYIRFEVVKKVVEIVRV